MARFLKIAGLLVIGLLLFFAALLFTFYHLVQIGEFRNFLIAEVERQTQLKVRVGEGTLRVGRVLGITFRDVALLEPQNDRPVIEAERVLLHVALFQILQRRLVFDEILLHQPRVQIVREEQGRIPLLEWILSLPFQKRADVRFDLDLREIKIEKGEVLFLDYRKEGPALTRFRELSLELQRNRLKEALLSVSDVAKEFQSDSLGTLYYNLNTTVERNGQRAALTSKGRIVLPKDGFALAESWLEGDIRAEKLPADLFHDYYGHLLPVNKIQGLLDARLSWQGSLARDGQVKGEIGFKRLELVASDLFPNPLVPGDGRLELQADWSPKVFRLSRLDLRSREISLTARGSARLREGGDHDVEMRLSTPFLPVAYARKYAPLKAFVSPPWERLIGALNQGEVKLSQAGISGRLSEIRRIFQSGLDSRLWLDAEFRELGGNPGEPYLPLRAISGRIRVEKGALYYRGFKGAYGLSQFVEFEGSQRAVTGESLFELRTKGEADLAELRGQLRLGFFPPNAAKLVTNLEELDGKAKFGMSLRKDAASFDYNGQLSVENARLRAGDLSFAQITGQILVSATEIYAERLTALLAGSPIQVRIALKEYQTEKAAFDLVVESSGVRAGVVTRTLLSQGSLQDPGTVRGTIRYQGLLNSAAERKFSGSLELIGIELPVKFFSQSLRNVAGKLNFDGTGMSFESFKGQVAGYGFDFSGQWRYAQNPEVVFIFSAPEMDLARVLARQTTVIDDWYERLRARGKIVIDKGRYEGFEFSDLRTDLTIDKRVWYLEKAFVRSEGGTVQGSMSLIDGRDDVSLSAEPNIQGVPVQAVLRWFDVEAQEITGQVYATGRFESNGATRVERRQNLSGDFRLEIKDGIIRRMRLLVNILNVMDLTRWFSFRLPDFTQRGVRFRSVTGDFKVSKGIFRTGNLVVDSDDISITGAGQYDRPNDSIDALVALRPFPRMGSVANYIPLIGPGIAAIKDTVMVASFHVKGPMDNPIITPAPLSTLSEFFFSALKIPQRLITIPGTGKP